MTRTALDVMKKFYSVKLSNKKITGGIKKTKWPARLQFISKNALIDCAHNPAGFNALAKELRIIKQKNKFKKIIFVVGILRDKNIKEMLRIISPLASFVIFTRPNSKRAAEPSYLFKTFKGIYKNKKIIKIKLIKKPKKALEHARKIMKRGDFIVITGSIYLAGEFV